MTSALDRLADVIGRHTHGNALYDPDWWEANTALREAQYEDFVLRYCDGETPTFQQRAVIYTFIANPDCGVIFYEAAQQRGRRALRRWLHAAMQDRQIVASVQPSPRAAEDPACDARAGAAEETQTLSSPRPGDLASEPTS